MPWVESLKIDAELIWRRPKVRPHRRAGGHFVRYWASLDSSRWSARSLCADQRSDHAKFPAYAVPPARR